MEEIPDKDLCLEFIDRARKTQPWFKFINPFSDKPIVKGSATYNKILKKCQPVRFASFIKERRRDLEERAERETQGHEAQEVQEKIDFTSRRSPQTSPGRHSSRSLSPSRSPSLSPSRSRSLSTSSPIRSPVFSSSSSKSDSIDMDNIFGDLIEKINKVKIESPKFLSSESPSPTGFKLKLSKTPSPPKSPLQTSMSPRPRSPRSLSPVDTSSFRASTRTPEIELEQKDKGLQPLYTYSPDNTQTLELSFPLRSRSMSRSRSPSPSLLSSGSKTISRKRSSSSSDLSPFQYAFKQKQKEEQIKLSKPPAEPKIKETVVVPKMLPVPKKVIQKVLPVKESPKMPKKSPSPPSYPLLVPPAPTKSIPKRDLVLDTNKCKQLIELAEGLEDGEKIINPFTNKKIIKGKGTYQKLIKDCQKFIRQNVDQQPKVEEFDLEDILTFDF
jgi:hypothetical protein